MFKHVCSSVWNKGPPNSVFLARIKSCRHPPVSRRIRSSLQSRNIACGNRVICSTMDSAGDLCRDAIYEVLTRSSMETVGKYRLLSKKYNKLLRIPFHKATQPKNQHCLWFSYSKHDQERISVFLCFN